MKRYIVIVLVSLSTICSWALTRKEFCGNNGEIQIDGFFFKENGTGTYSSYAECTQIKYDGAIAWVTFNTTCGNGGLNPEYIAMLFGLDPKDTPVAGGCFNIPFKWIVVDENHIKVTFGSSFSSKPSGAVIEKWVTKYVDSQYRQIKKMANQWYQETVREQSKQLGKSYVLKIIERDGAFYLYHNDKAVADATFKADEPRPILSSSNLSSSSPNTRETYEPQYTDASYPYGEDAINDYLAKYIKYPSNIQRDGLKKTAFFTLEINSDGKVTNVTSSGSSNNSIDVEIIEQTKKLLKRLPYPFTPATQDGKNVASSYQIGINYDLAPALIFEKTSIALPYSQKEERIKVTARKDWNFTQPQNSSLSVRRDGSYLVVSCKQRRERDYDVINDKIIVSATDNSASYTINISQAGSPRPFVRVEKNKVIIPRDGTSQTISVYSNRKWSVANPYEDSRFKLSSSSSTLTIGAKKNLSKKGRSVSYGLKTADGEASTSIEVYQNGRADESNGTSGYGRIYENYYERNGRYGLTYANLHLGVGAPVPAFDEVYIPFNVEAFALRIYMVELSLASFRADFSIDGFESLAWEPQLKFLLPINEKVAILPYAGPTCQMDIYDIHNSTWSFSAGAIVRLSWGRIAFSDFSIDYHGGPFGGLSMGLSIGFASGYSN